MAVEPPLAIGGIEVVAVLDAIGQARSVAQQIDHAHRPRAWAGHKRRFAATTGIDPEIGKFGHDFGHRIIKRDQPLFDQHHERDRHDRLGHRGNAADRIG